MRPQGNCQLAFIGTDDFDAINQSHLQNLSYSQNSIPGETRNNLLTNGIVFGVLNTSIQPAADFDYTKVQVLSNAGGSINQRHRKNRFCSQLSAFLLPGDTEIDQYFLGTNVCSVIGGRT
jgi:hypothetical protein